VRVDGSPKQVTSQRFCEMLRKFSELHPYRPEFSTQPTPRIEAMRQARERGRHTAREWWALVVKVGRRCHYCGIECSPLKRPSQRITKDHRIPVSRGGSDAIENIVVACRGCNSEKSNMTEDEYLQMWNPRPRPVL
jgi:5-methylcytosine-specific restriction endonuclease McrA